MEHTTQVSGQVSSMGVAYLSYKRMGWQQWTYQSNNNTLFIVMKGTAKLFLRAETKYLLAIHCQARCTHVLLPYALLRTTVHMHMYNTQPAP